MGGSAPTAVDRRPSTRRSAVLLALRYYGRELAGSGAVAVPAMLLPALGNIGINYIAPLIVAKLVGRIAGGSRHRARLDAALRPRLRRRPAARRGAVARSACTA